jgi:hypothetical protein
MKEAEEDVESHLGYREAQALFRSRTCDFMILVPPTVLPEMGI